MNDVPLKYVKAHLSELVRQVTQGKAVRITRRGKPVAQIASIDPEPKLIDLDKLRALTNAMLWRDNLDEKPATIRMRIGSGDVVMIVAARQAGKYYFCSR